MAKPIRIYGFHAIQAQLKSNPEGLIRVYILNSRNDKRLKQITATLASLAIDTQQVNKQQLNKLTNNQTHQGIAAEVLPPTLPDQNAFEAYLNSLKTDALILILDSIQDPRNLGACLRSANAAGADCVIINKDRSAPINALVHKTAAGALNQLKVFQVTNLSRTIKILQARDIWVIGLENSANQSLYQTNLTAATAVVMGSEGSGLRVLTKKSCDQLAHIPMQGHVESLNVSVATGIALFEANRQRHVSMA